MVMHFKVFRMLGKELEEARAASGGEDCRGGTACCFVSGEAAELVWHSSDSELTDVSVFQTIAVS